MAKITRFFQKIFAGGITPTGNVARFGSLAAGAPSYSNDPTVIQSLPAWDNGWASATIGNQSPAFQDFNAYQYVATLQLAYLLQAGIPEWNTDTVYYQNSFCQVSGVVYKSKTNDNQGNAVGENANWGVWISAVGLSGSYNDLSNRPSISAVGLSGSYNDLANKPSGQLARAWVTFQANGSVGNQTIKSQFNVSSVNKTAVGNYTVNFTTAIGNTNYTVSPSSIDIGIANNSFKTSYSNKLSGSCVIINKSGVTGESFADSPEINAVFFSL